MADTLKTKLRPLAQQWRLWTAPSQLRSIVDEHRRAGNFPVIEEDGSATVVILSRDDPRYSSTLALRYDRKGELTCIMCR